MPALLEARALHAGYGETRVLHGIDFAVEQGGVTALLGANGAGKTTTLRAICGMVRTSGRNPAGRRAHRRQGDRGHRAARRGACARRPRHLHGTDGRGEPAAWRLHPARPRRAVAADFERVFGYFPRLRERFRQQAGTLSGGEQQMLAIARALLLRPRLLLLDEPSFGLAPLIVQEIFAIMQRISAEEGVSILLVEQNASLALDIADQAYLLETGRIVVAGPAAEIRRDESVRRSYLGY